MTSGAAAPAHLTVHREAIEEALRSSLADDDRPLGHAARYVMGWEDAAGRPTETGGKRIRPALCLMAASLFDDASSVLPGAVAVELVHNFSLVHDEIQDRDEERHHRPTIWTLVGEAQAINVGDYLCSRATQVLLEADAPSERRVEALGVLQRAIADMIGGQWADLSFEARDDVSVDEYLAMIDGKTGALIGAPLEIGAILAGAEPDAAAGLGAWGRRIGLAFQARDDILGIWGDPNLTGKSNVNDLARKKKSLPVLAGLADTTTAPAIRALYAQDAPAANEIAAVVALLDDAGVRERSEATARGLLDDAAALLDGLPLLEDAKRDLRAVASYLVDRSA